MNTDRNTARFPDENGNSLIVKRSGATLELILVLVNQHGERHLGTINTNTRTLNVKRNRKKHLMQVVNGYGFNYMLLDTAKSFDRVRLVDEYAAYSIPRTFILENGKILNFKQQGFEVQIFVSLEQIEPYKLNTLSNN